MTITITPEEAALVSKNAPSLLGQSQSTPGGVVVHIRGSAAAEQSARRTGPAAPPPRLGSVLAGVLQLLGIASIVGRLQPGNCGCVSRQLWLDRNTGRIETCCWAFIALGLLHWLLL